LIYKVLSGRLRTKEICSSDHEQERHLALGMPSLEWLMLEGRERESAQNNKDAKSKQLKLSKT
jgi:hypothetical protein